MAKTTKITFKRDFSPRKKGETAELETKLAEYYLSIGVAELPCTGCDDAKPCEKCNETKKESTEVSDANLKTESPETKSFDPIGETKKHKNKK